MANANPRTFPKGIKEIRYPSEDIILRFTSKDYTGEISLNNETGEFRFSPALDFTGIVSFLDLDDTPSDYIGDSLRLLQVNSLEDGLEFTSIPTVAGLNNLSGLGVVDITGLRVDIGDFDGLGNGYYLRVDANQANSDNVMQFFDGGDFRKLYHEGYTTGLATLAADNVFTGSNTFNGALSTFNGDVIIGTVTPTDDTVTIYGETTITEDTGRCLFLKSGFPPFIEFEHGAESGQLKGERNDNDLVDLKWKNNLMLHQANLLAGANISLTYDNIDETVTISTPSASGTDLTSSRDASTVTVESSTGTNATLPAATTGLAGIMTATDKTNLDANTAKPTSQNLLSTQSLQFNFNTDTGQTVPANGQFKYTTGSYIYISDTRNGTANTDATEMLNKIVTGDAIHVKSVFGSDGVYSVFSATGPSEPLTGGFRIPITVVDDDTLPSNGEECTIFIHNKGFVDAPSNGSQYARQDGAWSVVNVTGTTNLSFTRDATTVTVESDTGTDAVLPAVTTSLAGVITATDKTNLDANTAKVSFPEAPSDGTPYARQDAGWVSVASLSTEAWTALTLAGTWTGDADYSKIGNTVRLRINASGGSTQTISTLPVGRRPSFNLYIPVFTFDDGSTYIGITSAGAIDYYGASVDCLAPNPGYVYLEFTLD